MRIKPSSTLLILANLYPLVGVLFFGWDLASILFIYWAENVVIGFYNILKMVYAKKPNTGGITVTINGKVTKDFSKKGFILFFIMHYGLFTVVHGAFLFTTIAKGLSINSAVLTGTLFLIVSHGISFFTNYITGKEYETKSPEDLFLAPYKRVIVMHLTVIFGSALIVNSNGTAIGPLLTLTVVKTIIDLISHTFEHNKTLVNPKASNTKVYHIKPDLVKRFIPGYEKIAANAYKLSVENGTWEQTKAQMDPETVKYVEDYWLNNHGIKNEPTSN